MDSQNFLGWAKSFVDHVHDLTAGNRCILVTYDVYRADMSLSVLKLPRPNNIIAYPLPAHTSGKTQACNVVLFGEYKRAMNQIISDILEPNRVTQLNMFNFCAIMKHAYHYPKSEPRWK